MLLQKLQQVGVSTIGEFLKYFPRTYTDQSELINISEIRTDQLNTIKGTLTQIVENDTEYLPAAVKQAQSFLERVNGTL